MSDVFRSDLFAGKTAVVAGGTSGICRQIARRIGELGANIFVLSRDQAKIDDTLAEFARLGIKAGGQSADVRNFDTVASAMASCEQMFGKLDIVVSGAAGNFIAQAEKMSANAFATVIGIDLQGTFHVFRAAHQYMNPGSSMLAISATQGQRAAAGQAHVCAAKAGIDRLCQSLAIEWGPAGIRVNSLSPGPVADTEGMDRLTPGEQATNAYAATLPAGRYATKDEVADIAIYLSSPAASYVTGAIINCDGGSSLVGQVDFLSMIS